MTGHTTTGAAPLGLRAGDVVEVRSEAEIRATLDASGAYEGLPFMDEMRPYCGRRFRVFRAAEKVCIDDAFLRRMRNAVFLDELRCDGSAHDGCRKACMLFWKEAWLRRAEGPADRVAPTSPAPVAAPAVAPGPGRDTPAEAEKETATESETTYSCQATSLLAATEPLSRWDLGQYVRDVTSGNFTLLQEISALMIVLYNRVSRLLGGLEYGAAVGTQSKTPAVSLALQPGEIVEVRSRDEIIATLDPWAKNRGLQITYEMLRHSGRRFRVLSRVDRMILETDGRMREIKNTVLLDGTACEGVCRRSCARYTYPMWREAWLKRVEDSAPK